MPVPALGRLGRLRHQLAVTVLGHGADITLSTVASLLIFASVTPSQWAFYAASLAALRIAHKISELGLDIGTVRTVSKAHRTADPASERGIIQAVLSVKLSLSVAVLAIGWLTAPIVADDLLDHSGLIPYLRLAYFGIFGRQLLGFHKAWLAARLRFGHHAALVASGPTILCGLLIAAHLLNRTSVAVCLGATVVAQVTPVELLTLWKARGLAAGGFQGFGLLRGIWSFSRWTYITGIASTLRAELGTLVLLALMSSTTAGLYDAGNKLASRISILSNSLLTVLVPRAAHLGSRDELREFLRQSHRWILLLAILAPLSPLAADLVRPAVILLNPDFEPALGLFVVLLISMLFTIAALPSRTVLYSVHRPEVETALELCSLTITVVFSVLLIPEHGAVGAAWAMLVQRAIAATATIGFVYHKIYTNDRTWLRIDERGEAGQLRGPESRAGEGR